ncbi:MAG: hypothetical protein QGG40_14550, partial [Myxococcota bacterium]|nr:hypothetical protein [Myxococcota bacterium]
MDKDRVNSSPNNSSSNRSTQTGGASTPTSTRASTQQTQLGNAAIAQQVRDAASRATSTTQTDDDSLDYGAIGWAVGDAQESQTELDKSVDQKAIALHSAIEDANPSQIYRQLGGAEHTAVKNAFEQRYGVTVTAFMQEHLSGAELSYGLSFARYGKADLQSRVRAVTEDIVGTDHDKLYEILEGATMEERYALANNARVIAWIRNDTSGTVEKRAMQVLRPLMNSSSLSPDARDALFERIKKTEAKLGTSVDNLITRLRARKGVLNDDEPQMVQDVKAWSAARGPTDIDTNANPAIKPLLEWLQSELSPGEFAECQMAIRSGDKPNLAEKIYAASSETTLGFGDIDQDGVWAFIASATLEERQALLGNPQHVAWLRRTLGETYFTEAMKRLEVNATGESATAYSDLLKELDSWLWVSDNQIFQCLEKMAAADLVELRRDDKVRARIEDGVTDVDRFHALIGYTGPRVAGTDRTASEQDIAQLASSDERLVARIEDAVD